MEWIRIASPSLFGGPAPLSPYPPTRLTVRTATGLVVASTNRLVVITHPDVLVRAHVAAGCLLCSITGIIIVSVRSAKDGMTCGQLASEDGVGVRQVIILEEYSPGLEQDHAPMEFHPRMNQIQGRTSSPGVISWVEPAQVMARTSPCNIDTLVSGPFSRTVTGPQNTEQVKLAPFAFSAALCQASRSDLVSRHLHQ